MEEEQNYGLTTTPQNGSQGDPLSMILYIIYDSDLVRTASGKQELTLAFVDDTAFLARKNVSGDASNTPRHAGKK